MAFKPTQFLAAAMLLSMAVAAMAARQDAPQAELEAKKKYGHKDDYHKDEYHAKEEYHPKEYYPPAGEHYPPTGEHYPKPHEYYPSPAYPPHYGPASPPYYPPSHDYYPKAPVCPDCPGTLTRCPTTGDAYECVNTQTNEAFCGSCNKQCGPNQICVGGGCQCLPGFTDCDRSAAGLECVRINDNCNCGDCGEVCDVGEGFVCQEGEGGVFSCGACEGETPNICTTGCGASETAICTNFETDPENCGECGNNCLDLGENYLCQSGECQELEPGECIPLGNGQPDCTSSEQCCQTPGGPEAVCCLNTRSGVQKCTNGRCTGTVIPRQGHKHNVPAWARAKPTRAGAKKKKAQKAARRASKKAAAKKKTAAKKEAAANKGAGTQKN